MTISVHCKSSPEGQTSVRTSSIVLRMPGYWKCIVYRNILGFDLDLWYVKTFNLRTWNVEYSTNREKVANPIDTNWGSLCKLQSSWFPARVEVGFGATVTATLSRWEYGEFCEFREFPEAYFWARLQHFGSFSSELCWPLWVLNWDFRTENYEVEILESTSGWPHLYLIFH